MAASSLQKAVGASGSHGPVGAVKAGAPEIPVRGRSHARVPSPAKGFEIGFLRLLSKLFIFRPLQVSAK